MRTRILQAWLLACVLLPAPPLAADARLDEAEAQMRKWLDARDVERRRIAAEALGGYPERADTAGLLGAALGDRDAVVRRHAAASLWELADRDATLADAREALRGALADPDPAVRVQAAGALDRSGENPHTLVEARRSVLAEGDWFDVALAARGLVGEVDAAELVDPLLGSLLATPPQEDADAFTAEQVFAPLLQATDGERAVPGLLAALDDPRLPKVALIEALGARQPPPPAWPARLQQLAGDADPLTRAAALEQLRVQVEAAAAGSDWALPLSGLIDDPYLAVREAAVRLYAAARGAGHPGVAALLARLEIEQDADLRRAIVRALGAIGDPAEAYDRPTKQGVAAAARPALLALREHPDAELREAVAQALTMLDQGSATGTEVLPVAAGGSAAALARLRAAGVELTRDALFRAINQREVQTVSDLLQAGLDANTVADAGMTALHHAVLTCDYGRDASAETREVIAALLRHGADPNRQDAAGGNSVLHRAGSCDGAVVKQLVNAGAKPGLKNEGKLSAFILFAVSNPGGAAALLDAGHRPDAAERQMLQGMLAAEQDAAKRRLLQRALGTGLAVER